MSSVEEAKKNLMSAVEDMHDFVTVSIEKVIAHLGDPENYTASDIIDELEEFLYKFG